MWFSELDNLAICQIDALCVSTYYSYENKRLFGLFVPASRIFICAGRVEYDPKTKHR